MEQKPKAHVAKWKKELVNELVKEINSHKVVGIFDVNNLPTYQLQTMRRTLAKNKTKIKIVKKTLAFYALEEAKKTKKGIEQLEKYLDGQIGILFTDENPFSLYKLLKKSRTQTFAKAGQVAPKDLVIPAGPTPFAPGPIIGELGQLGVKTGVEKGKVVVKQDTVVAKAGQVISAKLAEMLKRFNIQPIEIGLNVHAVYEDGIVYESAILDIDETYYVNLITDFSKQAFALSCEIGYISKDNAETIIGKIAKESIALATEIEYISKDTIERLLAKGEQVANYLNSQIS
ncbi:MAG: 50S ribosomal protein L10 [Candidatus Woesearchaeota archaeon]